MEFLCYVFPICILINITSLPSKYLKSPMSECNFYNIFLIFNAIQVIWDTIYFPLHIIYIANLPTLKYFTYLIARHMFWPALELLGLLRPKGTNNFHLNNVFKNKKPKYTIRIWTSVQKCIVLEIMRITMDKKPHNSTLTIYL